MCVNCGTSSCAGCGPWLIPQGPKGDTGETGPQGIVGPAGPPGPAGPSKNKTDITFSNYYKNNIGADVWAPYSRVSTAQQNQKLIGHFIYEGSTLWTSPPTKIKIAVDAYSDFTMTGTVFVKDITNNQVIGSATSVNTNGYQILDLGTLANIPAGEAIFGVYGFISAEGEAERMDVLALSMY